MNIKSDSILPISLDQEYEQIMTLLIAHDIDLVIKVLSQCKYSRARELLEKIVASDSSVLPSQEKIMIVFGIASHSAFNKNMQYELLDFLLIYPQLYQEIPIFLTLARSKYADMIALVIAWGKERQRSTGKTDLLLTWAERAFTMAVVENDHQAVEMMLSKKLRINKTKASQLLWDVIDRDKNSALVSLLVRHAQADVNYVGNGKTLLIAAVERNNIDIVRILLEEGAVVDRIIDSEIGTALHIAMKNRLSRLEELLREYGAA